MANEFIIIKYLKVTFLQKIKLSIKYPAVVQLQGFKEPEMKWYHKWFGHLPLFNYLVAKIMKIWKLVNAFELILKVWD